MASARRRRGSPRRPWRPASTRRGGRRPRATDDAVTARRWGSWARPTWLVQATSVARSYRGRAFAVCCTSSTRATSSRAERVSTTGRGGSTERGAGAGASSTITWQLVPLKPNALTAARRGASDAGHGRPSRATVTGIDAQSMWGDSSPSRQVRGDLAVLQRQHDLQQAGYTGGRLEVPDVGLHRRDEEGPVGGPSPGVHGIDGPHLDRIAECRARAVGLHQVDVGRFQPGVGQCPLEHLALGDPAGHGQPAAAPVVVDGGAPQDGQHAVAVGLGVGQPLQDHDTAPLGPHVAVGAGPEGVAPSGRRQGPELRQEDQRQRVEHEVDPADDGHAAGVGPQGLHRLGGGHQRRGAGGVERDRGAAQPEHVGDATGGHRQRRSGAVVAADRRRVAAAQLQVRVVGRAEPDEHPGGRAGQAVGRDGGVLQRLPRHLEEQALLRIQAPGLHRRDAEEGGVELVHRLGEEAAAVGVDRAHAVGVRVVVAVMVPPGGGDADDAVATGPQQFPVRLERARPAREPAAGTDDGDRLRRRLLVALDARLQILQRDESPA